MKIQWSKLSPRERDALVAEKVMELKFTETPDDSTDDGTPLLWMHARDGLLRSKPYPKNGGLFGHTWAKFNPTTCPKACSEVKAKLGEIGCWKVIKQKTGFYTAVRKHRGLPWGCETYADSEEEAVCIASLRACGIEVDQG